MKQLEFAADLALPLDAVTQTFAFSARRGAGKTYGASKLAEGMLLVGAQIVVLDPVGVWWGLRVGADGKAPGFDIPVFGGLHGDIPLQASAGKLVADVVIDRGVSVVLDVSMFRKNERKQFATDFAEELFHRKKSSRSPVHLFVEEAQVFVPQRVGNDEARMLGAFEDIIKLGRNFGIGATLITQRPQAVNKDALNQTECLVVLQTNGSQERKALRDWIVDQGLDVVDLVNTLPTLKQGEAWVWSPSWLRVTKRVHIAKKRTFNASATPEVGKLAAEPRKLAAVDLDEIRGAMSDTIEKAKADDPKELRKRIAELERELRTRDASPTVETKIERVEVPVISRDDLDELAATAKYLSDVAIALGTSVLKLQTANGSPRQSAPIPSRKPERVEPATARVRQSHSADSDTSLGKGERAILTVLAQYQAGKNKRQLGTLCGYSASGGSFNTYVSRLRTKGYVEGSDPLRITDLGLQALGDYDSLPFGDELAQYWLARLGKGEAAILRALIDAYPREMSKQELGEISGYEHTGGSFNTYLSRLRTRDLIEPGQLKASSAFFEVPR